MRFRCAACLIIPPRTTLPGSCAKAIAWPSANRRKKLPKPRSSCGGKSSASLRPARRSTRNCSSRASLRFSPPSAPAVKVSAPPFWIFRQVNSGPRRRAVANHGNELPRTLNLTRRANFSSLPRSRRWSVRGSPIKRRLKLYHSRQNRARLQASF